MDETPTTAGTAVPSRSPSPRLAVGAVAALTCFAVLATATRSGFGPLHEADESASAAFHELGAGSPHLVTAMEWVTLLGNRWLWVAGGSALALFLLLRRNWREGIFVALTCLTPGLAPLTAELVGRERPTVGLVEADGFGHPSGHALTAAAMVTTLLVLLWPRLRPPARGWSIAAALLVVVAVGTTRVGLVVHYPSDVVSGWLLGSATVLLLLFLTRLPLTPSARRH